MQLNIILTVFLSFALVHMAMTSPTTQDYSHIVPFPQDYFSIKPNASSIPQR